MLLLLVLIVSMLLIATKAFTPLKLSPRRTAPMKLLPVQIDANYNLALGSLLIFGQLTGVEKIFSKGNSVAKVIAVVADKARYIFAIFSVFLTYQTTTLRYHTLSLSHYICTYAHRYFYFLIDLVLMKAIISC